MANNLSLDAHGEGIVNRHLMLADGEKKLRAHLPPLAPLKLGLVFGAERRRWEVLAQYTPEGNKPIFLGTEDLESFPSDTLIAQAMLLS